MRVSTFTRILAVLTFAIVGCDSSDTGPPKSPHSIESRVSPTNDTSPNHSELAETWERFISSAKSKESEATENYIKRRRNRPGTVKVKWGISDVVKSDSITAPYIGKVDVTVFLTDEFSTGKFQYSLQFVPSGKTWRYRGGKKQRFDRSGTDEQAIDYPELEDEVLVLFSPAH